jgi:serine/threonine protein kinase/Tol biopolymer transport system component
MAHVPLSVGAKLGPYEILAPIGAGGMGEVWKARDTRLNRFVAIKTSNQRFSERFEREAQAIASLNHPHICSLYDAGPDYLVMEYVEGQPLRSHLPLDQALTFAGQILDALDAAHRKGIIHRDLKPDNILLGQNGVKVLDFGLAKFAHAASAAGGTQAVTESVSLTAEGSILGTLHYMSPEQLEGQEADARSDIFSFGVVLYELITGKRPFNGKSAASVVASILKEQPRPLQELEPLSPLGLDAVLQTCLEKDPGKRWQSAREVRHSLEWVSTAVPTVAAGVKTLRLWRGLAALMALIAVSLAGWMFLSRAKPPDQTSRFEALLPENVSLQDSISVSPDGHKLVFTTLKEGVWIRDFSTLEWQRLPGTEGAASPFWSPDSRHLAFAAGNQLKKIDVSGGPPQTLCTVPTNASGSGDWNRDGVIVFGSWGGGAGGPLWKVADAGGVATAITAVDAAKREFYHTWPTFLPDGKHFLYFRSGPAEVEGVYVGSLDANPGAQSRDRILATGITASYGNGYLFFLRAGTLMAQQFDLGRLQLKGEPVPVAEGVATTWFGSGVFSVSPGGALAYHTRAVGGSVQLTWLDRQGKIVSTFGQPGTDVGVILSPDGTRAAVRDSSSNASGDLWTLNLSSGGRTRLTFGQSVGYGVAWSPDGSRIAFTAGNRLDTLYEKDSSGVGDARELLKVPGTSHWVSSWSPDGRFLLYNTTNTPKTGYDLWVLPLQGDRKPVLLLGDTFNEWAGTFSPDMRWIAYVSNETDRAEVYVRPFLASGPSGVPALGEGRWQVSKDVGNFPRWRANGREIIFDIVATGTAKFAVEVNARGAVFESGIPRQLFAGPIENGWDVTPDGQRFLLAVPQVQRTTHVPITVVLNWPALLKK